MKREELCSSLLHCVSDSVGSSSSRSLVFKSTFTNMDKLTIPTVRLIWACGVKHARVIYAHFIRIYSSHDHCKCTVCVHGNAWVLTSNVKCLLIWCVFAVGVSPFLVCAFRELANQWNIKETSGGLLNTYTPSHTWARRCTAAGVSIASEEEARIPDSLKGKRAITNPAGAADQQQIGKGEVKKTACVCLSPAEQGNVLRAAAVHDKKEHTTKNIERLWYWYDKITRLIHWCPLYCWNQHYCTMLLHHLLHYVVSVSKDKSAVIL